MSEVGKKKLAEAAKGLPPIYRDSPYMMPQKDLCQATSKQLAELRLPTVAAIGKKSEYIE